MALDPARLAAHARATLAWATLASVLFLAVGAVIMVTNPGEEFRGGTTRYVVDGDDYFASVDVFWRGDRMSGYWHTPPHWESPGSVRLVAGSDVARILAGQEPQHVYATFTAWGPGLWTGDANFVVPEFTCRGPTGGCEPGDLPAVVFTRGDSWEGTSFSALSRPGESTSVPVLELERHSAWVMPAVVIFASLATVALLVALVAGIAWPRAARRVPSKIPTARVPLQGTEAPLHLVHLAQMYLGSMARSLYLGAGLATIALLGLQIWGIAYLTDSLLEAHFPLGSEIAQIWISLLYWLIVPFAFGIAAVYWIGHLRELRAERRRWQGISQRLTSLETQVLG